MRITFVRQAEKAECSLACLAMVAAYYGDSRGLAELRALFPTSLKGVNLQQLITIASTLGLAGRALRVELDALRELKVPCILHWNLNHFVVLKKVDKKRLWILDPAGGERILLKAEASKHFTGVAVEFTPNASFTRQVAPPRIRLSDLTGKVGGLFRSLGQVFIVALVLELFVVCAPLFSQLVIDEVISVNNTDLLPILVIGFGIVLITQVSLSIIRSWMLMILSQTFALQWLGNMFAHLIKLPLDYFEKRHVGDLVSRFNSIRTIQTTLTTSFVEAVLDGLMSLAALFMMLLYAWNLAFVSLAAVAAYALLRFMSYGPFRAASAERLVIAARESSHFLETLRSIITLKLFGREEDRRARWQNLIVDIQNRDIRTTRMHIAFTASNSFISGVENLAVFWIGAKMVLAGQAGNASSFTVGMLFAYVAYKGQFVARFSSLIDFFVDLKMLGLQNERLADIALAAPEKTDAPTLDLDGLEASIELRGVSFRYSDAEPWVLKNVSFKVESGDSIAVTGTSGSGKTTLIKVMLGLLIPTEGEIFFGGISVSQLGLRNVRRIMGTVMQDDSLLTGSLADNVSFFADDANSALVERCCRMAQIHDEIVKMPMGYRTLVGDLGSGLSGGQKQRLFLARALYKGPRILVLDEATSQLDVANERAVTQALAAFVSTRIVIAHRPETIAGAQRVVQMREGAVVEVAQLVRLEATKLDGRA